jgi:hypothetical protein
MDENTSSGMWLKSGVPECFKYSPSLDPEILDAIRPFEADFPEGIYSAQHLGISEERHHLTNPIALLDSETRLELIRACVVHISHNFTGLQQQNFVQHVTFYDDDQVSEDANASNAGFCNGSIANPNVDYELFERAHSLDRCNSFRPEIIDNNEVFEQAEASNDDVVSYSDNLDNSELYSHSDGEENSDSSTSHNSLTSEYAESSDKGPSEYNASDDGAVEGSGTQTDSINNTKKRPPHHDLEQHNREHAHASNNSKEDHSDYAEKPRSKAARINSKTDKTRPKPTRTSSTPDVEPSRAINSSFRSYSPPTQTPSEIHPRDMSHLASGGKSHSAPCHGRDFNDYRLLPRFDSCSGEAA